MTIFSKTNLQKTTSINAWKIYWVIENSNKNQFLKSKNDIWIICSKSKKKIKNCVWRKSTKEDQKKWTWTIKKLIDDDNFFDYQCYSWRDHVFFHTWNVHRNRKILTDNEFLKFENRIWLWRHNKKNIWKMWTMNNRKRNLKNMSMIHFLMNCKH